MVRRAGPLDGDDRCGSEELDIWVEGLRLLSWWSGGVIWWCCLKAHILPVNGSVSLVLSRPW